MVYNIDTSCGVLLWKEFLHVLDEPGQVLTVFGYATYFFLVEVRLDLLAQKYLTNNVADV